MNKAILLIFTTLAAVTFSRADNSNELFKAANQQFVDGKYKEAINGYEAIVGQGLHSADLYYNLGNAYFKLNSYPSAILNYERAHLLNPDDEDIVFNLDLARTFTVDVIEPLPQFFIAKWAKSFEHLLYTDAWAYVALCAFAISLFLVAVFWFTGKYQLKRISFTLAIVFTLFFAVSLMCSINLRHQIVHNTHAIIFDSAIAAKSSPDNSGKDLFVLHAGTKIQLLRTVGEWCEVKISDGNKGWLPKNSFKKI